MADQELKRKCCTLQNQMLQSISAENLDLVKEVLEYNEEAWRAHAELRALFVIEATFCREKNIYETLLNAVDECSNDNFTKLIAAFLRGNSLVAETLLKSGTKLDIADWDLFVFVGLVLAGWKVDPRKDLLKLLLQFGLDNSGNHHIDANFLYYFIRYHVRSEDADAVEIVQTLLNTGIFFDKPDCDGWTPLLFSINVKNIQLTKFFIKKGANVNAITNATINAFPLFLAVEGESVEIIKLLLASGAEINRKNLWGITPLLHACVKLNPEIIGLLIRHGADVIVERVNGDNGRIETPFSFLSQHPDSQNANYKRCLSVLVKELAKLVFKNHPASKKIRKSIEAVPVAADYLQQFTAELEQMKRARFWSSHSYYAILEKSTSIKKLSTRMKDEELVIKFRLDASRFTSYQDELLEILNSMIEYKNKLLEIEARLLLIFRDSLPSLVIANLASNILSIEDLPLE